MDRRLNGRWHALHPRGERGQWDWGAGRGLPARTARNSTQSCWFSWGSGGKSREKGIPGRGTSLHKGTKVRKGSVGMRW